MVEGAVGKRGIPNKLSRDEPRLAEGGHWGRELLTDAIPVNLFALNNVKIIAGHGTARRSTLTIARMITTVLNQRVLAALVLAPHGEALVFMRSLSGTGQKAPAFCRS